MPFSKRPTLRSAFLLVLTIAWSLQTVAGELYTFTSDEHGFKTHSVFYDDGEEVIVVDAQFLPSIADQLIDTIRDKTDSPITKVIVTHPNPDKFNGLGRFKELGAEIISSQATADDLPMVHAYKRNFWVNVAGAINAEDYPELTKIDVTYSNKKVLTTKTGEHITLIQLPGDAMSSDHTVVLFNDKDALFVGDLIHNGTHAWLEGPLHNGVPQPNISAWIKTLEQLRDIDAHKVLGGRGDWGDLDNSVEEQIIYLQRVDDIIDEYIQSNENLTTELASTEAAQKHYSLVTDQIGDAFPAYKMPAMVQYSVYALLNQRAKPD